MVREKMIVEYPADTRLSQSSTTPGGRSSLLRDEDNHLAGHSVLFPADDDLLTRAEADALADARVRLTQAEAEAMLKLAMAGAAAVGIAATAAAVKAAPYVKKGFATLKTKLNHGEPELADETSGTIIEIDSPGRTTRSEQPPREMPAS
ncbi:hypothetical protein GTW44_11610 [Streptomyces sp. SID8360]|nr:hypothetical protein SACTE_3634 [Streptomyces sp. SirexAA-E]MYR67491.1 hypothetical protein [Streptomyces sp. SID4939]MYS04241.1 hypothetical protein [Streptomyces sp. SID4940]MYT61990.1 hypothetical protein [Streptomyces sp. SID8357]MYT85360.1 hypothetical protein [Streptomyces sp. SID8360]MYW38945.1 hypothetical protein [Streptomyces sp. SID1]PZX40527.1 hypothetical protein K373_02706 [Streptomyces sp. DvalAA-21]RAJ36692.1 hypothetical protein K351_02451 [Streptomyces sp. DpondAA-E10]R